MTEAADKHLSFEEWEDIVLRRLSDLFHSANSSVILPQNFASIVGCPTEHARPLLSRMIAIGAIELRKVESSMGTGSITTHHVSGNIDDIIATRSKPVDRVAAAQSWMRSHPVWSALVIILLVMYFLSGLLKNVTELVDWFIKIKG